MQFATQYDARVRVFSNPGDPIHITYAGHYDEKGRVVLEESGRENTPQPKASARAMAMRIAL